MCVLIVEDNPKDLGLASTVSREAGFQTIDSRNSIEGAKAYLETALQGQHRIPDAILLDLALGADSGYELLRMRYLSPSLMKVAVIVWSELDDHNAEICSMFKANAYLGKWQGAEGLRDTFAKLHLPVHAAPAAAGSATGAR